MFNDDKDYKLDENVIGEVNSFDLILTKGRFSKVKVIRNKNGEIFYGLKIINLANIKNDA